jgi:hypothetical protein
MVPTFSITLSGPVSNFKVTDWSRLSQLHCRDQSVTLKLLTGPDVDCRDQSVTLNYHTITRL